MKMNGVCDFLRSCGVATFLYFVTPVFSAPTSPYDKCGQLHQIDCKTSYVPEPNETVCCSDGNTYDNLCYFAKAKCQDLQLEVLYTGQCVSTTPVPGAGANVSAETPVGSTEDPTLDVIHSVFCTNYDQILCKDDLDPVCGSDNNFYRNECEFAKAVCKNDTLTQQDLSVCKTARRVSRITDLV